MTTESLRLENEMYHRWRKVSIIYSIVLVVLLPVMGLGVYALLDLPIMLVLVPVGFIGAAISLLLNANPIYVTVTMEGLTLEYRGIMRGRTYAWKDISVIDFVRRQGGSFLSQFYSLWLLDGSGKKINTVPIHLSVEILREIQRYVEENGLPLRLRMDEDSFLDGI